RPSFEPAAERPIADEGELAHAEPAERLGEPHDVLALRQRAEAEEPRLAVRRGLDAEALEVDAGVDHLGLAAGLGNLGLELTTEVVGDGDHGFRAADGQT